MCLDLAPVSVLTQWMNLCVDLGSLISDTWEKQSLKTLDNISLSGSCRLRRIYTMKLQLPDTTDDHELYGLRGAGPEGHVEMDSIPRMFLLGRDVTNVTQVSPVSLRHVANRMIYLCI